MNSSNTSLISLLQTPEAFPLQQILTQKSSYMNKLIDYISVIPDPFLMNQRQCYCYPLKSVQIMNGIGVYKLVVKKQQKNEKMIDVTKQIRKNDSNSKIYQYPYLQRLFKNLKTLQNEEILLGYIDRVLFSITKKTPQIYQFFKDNQQALTIILNNDKILFAMKQFLILFLTQSTMMLYVFLKNIVLRALMFRIVENQDTGPMVYEMLCDFYSQLLKSYLTQTNEEDKQQIAQVLKNIEQENFIALLALKISQQHHRRTYFIAKILNQMASSPNNAYLVSPYIDTYTQYLQSYQQSQDFMLVIMPDQLMMLTLILKICSLSPTSLNDVKEQLLKRLLVYCNVHQKNSTLHNMLYKLIEILFQQQHKKMLVRAKIIQFLKNNLSEKTPLNFKSLIKRICIYFGEKKLQQQFENEEEKEFIRKYVSERDEILKNCIYFKGASKKEMTQNESSLSLNSQQKSEQSKQENVDKVQQVQENKEEKESKD